MVSSFRTSSLGVARICGVGAIVAASATLSATLVFSTAVSARGLNITAGAAPSYHTIATTAEDRLITLSQILGALHHLAPLCEPEIGELWRDRMMEMIRLERPSTGQKNAMIAAFNSAFNDSRQSYGTCTTNAVAKSTKLAQDGERLARSLSQRIN